MRPRLWLSGLLLALAVSTQAQEARRLTLDQLFTDVAFSDEGFGPVRWLDSQTYTRLEPSASGGTDLVRYDAATGARAVLVAARDLVPGGASEPLGLANYHWSSDQQQLLIFTNTRRVWRLNTRGDYWVLSLRTKTLRKLGGNAPEATLMFAKFSPDGTRVGYVRENNLYVESLADGRITQLTHDGTRTLINGTFDWVYEEEFGLRDGFRWSPDGTRLAYWQLDASGIRDFLLLNNTDSLYSFVVPIQYPKVGTTNAAGRVGVVPANGGTTTWFEPSQDLRNHYIARMEWADRSDELILQHLNRKQNTLDLLLAEVRTGQMRTILTERDSAWVEVVDDLRWLDGGQRFTWVSERSGWQHVWLVSRDGQQMRNLTPSPVDVIRVVQIDTQGGWLYYMASPDNPGQRYLYRTRLDGRGAPERLSPTDQPGTHTYNLAPEGGWAIHTFSSFTTPPLIDVVRLPDHTPVQTLVDNAALRERLAPVALGQSRFFRIDIGAGVLLDGWEIRPPDFDPARKYPVLFYVYGEPAGQTVLDRWDSFTTLWHHLLAQQGYVVISIDNRGTPAPRGRHWRKQIYGAIGVQASADQAAANGVIRKWPYVDSTRIGIWGWSGGGSMTLNMLFRYPDLYQTGMSVAPVPDQRLYDTIYQERYMGLPQENAEGYRLGSPLTFAEHLRGNLLLVHGTGDDNVHYQGTERLINALIAHGKDFTMMAYPNRSHGIYEGKGTTRHLFGLLTRYLNQHLPAGNTGQF